MERVGNAEYKLVVKNLLMYIDSLCLENDIKYFVFYGTLLGTIRHSGFIPWDDDVDICMPREDYERFKKLFPRDNGRYRVINTDNCDLYPSCFSKVYDESVLIKIKHNFNYTCGAFIDVFPLDKVPEDVDIDALYDVMTKKTEMIVNYSMPVKSYLNLKPWKRLKFICNLPNYIRFHKNSRMYITDREKFMTQFNDISTKQYVDFSDSIGRIRLDDFDKLERHKFEDIEVNVPCGYVNILTALYGDYMKLPKEEERKTTHSFIAYKNRKYR